MSTMTEARPARPARTDIRRPASGIVIDPAGLTWWRDRRAMSRQDLSDMITVLWLDGHPDALAFWHAAGPPGDGHAAAPPRPVPGSTADPRVCTVCGAKIKGGLTRDGIAKIEHPDPARGRRPKARTLRALCAALSTSDEPVLPRHLQPGGPELPLSAAAQDRQARKYYNDAMVGFADALGRPELYTNSAGRRYYSKELREMYEQYLAQTRAGTGSTARVA
jgi:hypothetical protein